MKISLLQCPACSHNVWAESEAGCKNCGYPIDKIKAAQADLALNRELQWEEKAFRELQREVQREEKAFRELQWEKQALQERNEKILARRVFVAVALISVFAVGSCSFFFQGAPRMLRSSISLSELSSMVEEKGTEWEHDSPFVLFRWHLIEDQAYVKSEYELYKEIGDDVKVFDTKSVSIKAPVGSLVSFTAYYEGHRGRDLDLSNFQEGTYKAGPPSTTCDKCNGTGQVSAGQRWGNYVLCSTNCGRSATAQSRQTGEFFCAVEAETIRNLTVDITGGREYPTYIYRDKTEACRTCSGDGKISGWEK